MKRECKNLPRTTGGMLSANRRLGAVVTIINMFGYHTTNKQTNKQTNKRTNKRTNKQTNKQTKQTNKQTNTNKHKQIHTHTHTHTHNNNRSPHSQTKPLTFDCTKTSHDSICAAWSDQYCSPPNKSLSTNVARILTV